MSNATKVTEAVFNYMTCLQDKLIIVCCMGLPTQEFMIC